MSQTIRMALCQTVSDYSDQGEDPRPANVARAVEWVTRAANEGANIAVFGEIYLNGYRSDWHLRDFSTRLDPPDEHVERLVETSRNTGVYIVMGISRRGAILPGNLFNSVMLLGPDGVIGYYDKVHLGNFPLPDGRLATEGMYWNTGRQYRVFDTPWCRLGLQICRDVRYPEASRVLTLMGAEIIINAAAAVEVRHSSWDYFSQTRANENLVWFVMTSVVGQQKDFRLFGGSRIVNPYGEVVVRARDDEEELVIYDIDLNAVHQARALSHVLDRRVPAAYSLIASEEGAGSL